MGISMSKGPNLKKAASLVKKGVEEAREDIAQEAFDEVQQRLGAVLKNPTGYYESRVQVNTQANTIAITDGGVVYGAWLEGVSSRNDTTTFKGYQTFRKVLKNMEQKAETVADKAIGRAVKKI